MELIDVAIPVINALLALANAGAAGLFGGG